MPPDGYPAFLQYLQSGRVRKKQKGRLAASLAPPPRTNPHPGLCRLIGGLRMNHPQGPTPSRPEKARTPGGLQTALVKQRLKTRLGLLIFTLATDHAPWPCVVIVVM